VQTLTFYSTIKKGANSLQIPPQYREALQHASRVRVTIFLEPPTPPSSNLIDHLLDHPLQLPAFRPLPREATHARHTTP